MTRYGFLVVAAAGLVLFSGCSWSTSEKGGLNTRGVEFTPNREQEMGRDMPQEATTGGTTGDVTVNSGPVSTAGGYTPSVFPSTTPPTDQQPNWHREGRENLR